MKPDYFERLNIPRVINAAGTLTSLGGCRMRPEAMAAMANAGDAFVDLSALHRRAGEQIAAWLGVEAACVTAGAAAGISQALAACMTGADQALIAQLPERATRYKVVVQNCHRSPFERAAWITGAQMVVVGDAIRTRPHDLEAALDGQTAAILHFLQADMFEASLPLAQVLEIAQRYDIPVIVDAAAELPPKENLWRLVRMGADLVVFSGGKQIGGPQASGLLVGRADLVNAARLHGAPHEQTICRAMKAGKEQVVGLLAALEAYLAEDEEALNAEWENIAAFLEEALGANPALQVQRYVPTQPYIQPTVAPRLALTPAPGAAWRPVELAAALRNGDPPIYVEVGHVGLWLNTHTLTKQESKILLERVFRLVR